MLQHATLFQLIGIVVAPVYFTFFYAQTYINGAVLLFICVLAAYLIMTSIMPKINPQENTCQVQENKQKLDVKDYLFLFYIITTSAATLIFSANISSTKRRYSPWDDQFYCYLGRYVSKNDQQGYAWYKREYRRGS